MNADIIKAMIGRRAQSNRDRAAEIDQHDGDQTTATACILIAMTLEAMLADIEHYESVIDAQGEAA